MVTAHCLTRAWREEKVDEENKTNVKFVKERKFNFLNKESADEEDL